MKPRITVDGTLPKALGLSRARVKSAAAFFAAKSSARIGVPLDAITQGYDPMPGEEPGVYGEVYVNCDRAQKVAPKRRGWSPAKELLLYVAHGIDHLSGADDFSPKDYQAMRRRELSWIKDLTVS